MRVEGYYWGIIYDKKEAFFMTFAWRKMLKKNIDSNA